MPAVGPALGALIQKNLRDGFKSIAGIDPMGQPDPSKFIAFCMAIGNGIALGAPVLMYESKDTGSSGGPVTGIPNVIPGVGTGMGVQVDADDMAQRIYVAAYDLIKARIPNSTHDPWPPGDNNTGQYLKAIAVSVSIAIKDHYAKCWSLVSVHPDIYSGSGEIKAGGFSTMGPSPVKAAMQAAFPGDKAWPDICEGIAKGFTESIEAKATGKVSVFGICIPSPLPPFLCGIPVPGTGAGKGAAF